jgi:formiminotetrahydrofolate cyclodeaminase
LTAVSDNAERDLFELPVGELLDLLVDDESTIGSGASAAIVVSVAAALLVGCARAAIDYWDGAEGALAQAETLRSRSAPLAPEGAKAYARARVLLGTRRETDRDPLGDALDAAALAPLRMAEVAADVALLAVDLCEHGRPELAADAAAAAGLASAASSIGRHLVAVNLLTHSSDEYMVRADAAAAAATEANARANR